MDFKFQALISGMKKATENRSVLRIAYMNYKSQEHLRTSQKKKKKCIQSFSRFGMGGQKGLVTEEHCDPDEHLQIALRVKFRHIRGQHDKRNTTKHEDKAPTDTNSISSLHVCHAEQEQRAIQSPNS